ncbi:MAG: right-handed parallel beta-helix repeat-containing protein [Thermodesulfobacteriota bacterium]
MRTISASALATALIVAATLSAESSLAVVTCGQVVSTSGTFDVINSLDDCTGHGLRVTASNVTIDCAPGVHIDGVGNPGQYGILVDGPVSSVTVRDCLITEFNRGIRFKNVTGGSIVDNAIYDSLCTVSCGSGNEPYGIDITDGSSGITVDANEVFDAYDEGIHISGRTGTPLQCQSTRPGGHIISNNTVIGTAQLAGMPDDGEALYILCSDDNLVEHNLMIQDNDGPGIFLEDSRHNIVRHNEFVNDPIFIKTSERNAFFGNVVIAEQGQGAVGRVVLQGATSNFLGDMIVEGDGDAPDEAFLLRDGSMCNQVYNATAFGIDLYDIRVTTQSPDPSNTNNRFLEYDASFSPLSCSQTGDTSSTVDVYDQRDVLLGCNSTSTPSVDPDACTTWWFYSGLCGVAQAQENDDSFVLEGEDITTVRYLRANDGGIDTGADALGAPLRVTSTGCVNLSAHTQVTLGPGTVIEGKLEIH